MPFQLTTIADKGVLLIAYSSLQSAVASMQSCIGRLVRPMYYIMVFLREAVPEG